LQCISNDVILIDNTLKKTKILSQSLSLRLTKFSKSELKTRFGVNPKLGLRLKLWAESFGSAKD